MHLPTPSSLLILHWWTSYKARVKALLCSARTTVTLATITDGAAEATSNISSVAMLVSVLRDSRWTRTSLVSISSRIRRSRYSFTEELITIIPSALSLAHLRCAIQFPARVSRLMHGRVWARFSAAAKGTPFTHEDRRTPSLLMRRRSTSGAKPKYSDNLVLGWRSDSHGTSVGQMIWPS